MRSGYARPEQHLKFHDFSDRTVVMDDAQIAAALRTELIARIGPERYELWFASQTRMCVEAGCLTICAASAFVRDWLRRTFGDDLRGCWEAVVGRTTPIAFHVEAAADGGSQTVERRAGPSSAPRPLAVKDRVQGATAAEDGPARNSANAGTVKPCRGATLARFVVGPSNEYAFRSAELTAHGRQQASPVLFCGPTGAGKSHLLRAVLAEFRRRHPRARAVYLTAEQFTTSFVQALRGSGLPSFRQKCRGAELLLIDDLQFFAGKRRTIEELHHTVDTLLADGRQLVLASDRNLAGLRVLGPELASRLAGGLVCEIGPPEFATRLVILRQFRDELRLAADDDVLALVATQISCGARELRGAMHRLQAVSAALDRPITRDLVESALGDLARQSTRPVRLADVEQAVCDVFGVEPTQLRSERKGRTVSEPRMLAMWLARKYTRAAWSEIGQFFGRRSHSTVISAHRRVEKLISDQAQVGIGNEPCDVEEAIRRLETALQSA